MAKNRGGGRGGGRRPKQTTSRHYPRTARLNALLTEIVGDYFEVVEYDEVGDEGVDLGFLTVTGVEVDADLNVAEVFFSIFDDQEDDDAAVLAVLANHRKPVQRAIAQQAKLRKTPEVVFTFDPAVRAGAKIDSILATLDDGGTNAADIADPTDGSSS